MTTSASYAVMSVPRSTQGQPVLFSQGHLAQGQHQDDLHLEALEKSKESGF